MHPKHNKNTDRKAFLQALSCIIITCSDVPVRLSAESTASPGGKESACHSAAAGHTAALATLQQHGFGCEQPKWTCHQLECHTAVQGKPWSLSCQCQPLVDTVLFSWSLKNERESMHFNFYQSPLVVQFRDQISFLCITGHLTSQQMDQKEQFCTCNYITATGKESM